MERWSGKTAVVTGASAGIGASIALGLADAGLTVIGLARRPQLVDALQNKITGKGSIISRECDVSNLDEVTKTFAWIESNHGGTDILVNNAAVMYHGHITDVGSKPLNDEEIMSEIDVNIKGVLSCTRQAIASMKKRSFAGHIVNINSIAGHYIPFVSILNVYTSTKHAITAFTQALAQEIAEFGHQIKTTSISPGLVDTEMANLNRMPELREIAMNFPRLKTEDVTNAVLFAIGTPPSVNISELTIQPVGEKRL